jgi:uncharacterized cupin superfamily protein
MVRMSSLPCCPRRISSIGLTGAAYPARVARERCPGSSGSARTVSGVPVPEAPLEPAGHGLEAAGAGWFVLNVADANWVDGHFGAYTRFHGPQARFPLVGINIGVLQPGQAACMYHGEDEQEDFLILQGECLLLIEGQERRLRAWDFVHCPAWTEHVFVGAGDGPCTALAIGTRLKDDVVYPANPLARRHRAGVAETTQDPKQAYAGLPPDEPVAFRRDWLPW